MKKNGSYQRLIGRKEWMKKTFSCISEGGYLPFYKDEILPSESVIKSAQELWDYIEITGDDGEFLITKWRDEAERTTKLPKILTIDHHFEDDSNEEPYQAVKSHFLLQKVKSEEKRKKFRSLV